VARIACLDIESLSQLRPLVLVRSHGRYAHAHVAQFCISVAISQQHLAPVLASHLRSLYLRMRVIRQSGGVLSTTRVYSLVISTLWSPRTFLIGIMVLSPCLGVGCEPESHDFSRGRRVAYSCPVVSYHHERTCDRAWKRPEWSGSQILRVISAVGVSTTSSLIERSWAFWGH
jgi:hypothetical protein